MKSEKFQKTFFLTKFSFKRDWLKLSIWSVVLIGLFVGVAAKFNGLYGSKAAIDQIIKTLKSPAMVSLFGKMPNGPYTSADVFASEMTVFMAIIAAIMNYYFIIHNTRGEEESGILEMIQAHAVGRLSNLTAALLESFILNFGIGLIYAVGLQFANLTGTNANGNFLLGLGLGAVGFMFASIAAVIAQLTDNSRTATILSYLVFGIMYIGRMITDVSHPKYTWFIPMGWVEKLSTYKNNNWIPVFMMLGLSVILVTLAFYLNSHRDIGSGLIATRPGRAKASAFLRGPISLFWRLNRVSIIVWFLGIMILGATYGSVFNTIGDILKTNPMLKQLLNTKAINAANVLIIKEFIAILMIVFAALALIPGLSLINYLKTGETKGYLEIIHSTRTSRTKLYFSLFGIATITSIAVLFAGIYGLYAGGNAVMNHHIAMSVFMRGFYGYLSPLLVMLGISAFLIGWLPKLTSLNYGYLVLAFFVQYFGKLLKLPDWTEKITPFGFIKHVPVSNFDVATFWWQIAIAVILVIIGYIGYRRRDLIIN
ncbi:ABC transporter permease [Companilactobacillus huachuanensis]|uniref:ABC transporter permease n=1 Tax=Companilactobacillus huachuanensis TaxID=2559914 RepID=A0ABW1RK06_9LACO|nr:ABC transporter permease [Companilactobacillus huachuanensis]